MATSPIYESKSRRLFAIKQNPRRQSANSDCYALQNAILRLSDKEYEALTKFRADYPNLNIELMGKPANAFILFRSHFVTKHKEKHQDVNQKELSKLAGISWKAAPSSKQEPYSSRAIEAKRLWESMYPNGLSGSLAAVVKSLKKRTPGLPYQKRPSAPSRRKFKPFPSPPASDDVDFQEGMIEGYEEDASDGQDIPGDDGGEYLPSSKSHRQNRSSYSASSSQCCFRSQLMTPESTTRELTPPIPTFSDSGENIDPSTTFYDISLAELNNDCPSTFAGSRVFSEPFVTPHYSSYFEQLVVGYSFEEHARNAIMDWDQTDLMSNFEPIINNVPFCSDSYMADPADEVGMDLGPSNR